MKSKKLQKYQNSGPVSQSKDSGIITFESNPEYFNNRTFEKWQIKLLSSGEFGVDPKTNAIHKLKKPVSVPQEWLDVTSGNYEGSGTQRRFQAEAGLNQAYQNPLMYAPGSIGLGAYLTPAIRAGIPGAMEMLNAPLQIGSKTINPVTIANLATAAGAAQAPENIVSGVQNIIKGNYTEGAAGIGMAALDLIGPESISAAKPIGNYLRNLGNPAAGLDPLKYFKKQPIPGTNLYGRDSRSPFEEMLYNFYSKKSGGNKNGSNKKWSTIEPGDPINDATPPPKQEEVYETPTNIPLDYFSRRNKSIDISGTSALDILDSQAVKELKKSGESLNNFVNRVKTPEGRRRAKELGIDDVDSFVGRVSIHPFYDKPSYQTLGLFESKPIHAVSLGGDKFNPYEIRHELQHAIDTESNPLNTFGGLFMDDVPTSKIAEDLGKLKLKPSSGRKYKEDISHFSKDTEKPAFLSEIQEYLMQNNIVKNAYDRITPEDVMAGYKHSVDTKSNNGRLFKLIDETDYDNFKIISNNLNKMLSATPLVGLGAISSQQNKEQDTQKYQSGGAIMKTQKKKGLQKYQDSGYTKAPYNDPFASIFSNALGSGLYAYTNNNPFLNTHDSILGQPLATSVGEQGAFLGSLPMFQQLNKPLGSWDQESKGIENSLFEADGKKYGTAGSWKKTAEAWAKETGQDPRGYEKYVQDRAGQNYDSTVSAQKQWNEFGKPLAANMFAIDELNKLTEKSYNQGLKLDAQDLTKGTKGQEFRGFFAKDGMRVGNFQGGGISSFPYLSGMQDVPRSPIKDRKAQPSKVKSTLDNILEAVGINTGINAVSELSKVPALDTFYDLYNIADSYRQGDPFKATINEVGALIPGLSGKVIEAAVQDYIPKFPDDAKKKMKFILKRSSYDNMKLSEKYKTEENGPAYWYNPQFQKDYKDEIDNLEQGGSIKILHRSMGADTGLPHAGLGGFLKSVGKGIVNSVHDLGVGIADGFGNSTGLYDINNDKYKTGFGQNVAGFANTMSATTGKIGRAIASAAVPGVGGAAAGALGSIGSAVNPQGVAQTQSQYVPPQPENQQMDWLKMLSANPQIVSQFMGFLQGPQYGKGVGGYESGGQINKLQQILGYKDNSPFKGLPFQTINSNSITMDGVSQHLLAIADNGERRIMQPNSGLHNFQGANSVMEIPIKKNKNGGKITSPINLSKNINPFRLSPINSFGLGGFIRDGVPSRSKSEVGFSRQPISGATTKGPMGPKATDIPSYNGGVRKLMDMPENEYISTENLIPIQTEKGEMIVMPTGDLVKVMATKRHHQMDEDEVTDVAPEGAYILSSFGKVRINKDEAEQVITETGVKPYRIGGTQDSPTEKNLGSMMTKKSMAPADIAKRVDRFFPVNSTSNPFELAANNENKTHRVPYLEGLIQLSELDKLRKGIDSGMESQQQENEDEMTEAFKNGGSTWGGVPMRNMLIPKFQSSGGVPLKDPWSTALEVGTGLFQVGADLWNSYQQRKAQKEFVKKGTLLSDQAYGKARNEMGMGYLAGMLGVMNQDPTVTAKYNDPTYLRQMQTRTPMSTLEAISNRSYANMPNYMQSAPSFQAGLFSQQVAYAAALKAANDARLTIGEQDRNAQNDWLKLMQTNLELNNNNRVEAVNATRLNRNQQVGAVGNQTQGYMDSLANATLGQLSNQLSLEGVRANANVNFSNNIANSLKGGINTIGTAGLSYLDSRNRTTTNNPNAGYGSGVGPGYGGTGPSTPGYTCVGGSQYAINLDGSLVPTGKGC